METTRSQKKKEGHIASESLESAILYYVLRSCHAREVLFINIPSSSNNNETIERAKIRDRGKRQKEKQKNIFTIMNSIHHILGRQIYLFQK